MNVADGAKNSEVLNSGLLIEQQLIRRLQVVWTKWQPDLSTNDGCHGFQVINGDGKFNGEGLEDFATKVQLNQNPSYAVVAIIGPQSSGKSILFNHLFDTKFTVMDSSSGRHVFLNLSQTTQGIWLACPNIQSEHLMLVMDIEGTDGSERESPVEVLEDSLRANIDKVQKFKGKLVDQCTAAGNQEQPASGFSLFLRGIWKQIKKNKNLDLPAHKPLQLLVGLVAIRLEDGDAADNIEYMLASAFLGSEYQKALEELDSPTWPQREQKKKPKREQFLKVVEAISSMLAIAASILQIIGVIL
ncbi:hypothetical protein L6164_026379 [Bauhinia variegata]|uniref:Uncharacterized protein n=1 Tax=Bauhinia variegata TaxID=167791 RepID=A0ACB9LQY2_BAUVA|nr:hypothetical protein L6164_026379 [Bauhinia variegata]